jgi:vacuolar-type H+-ATPase subunit E/Vma4
VRASPEGDSSALAALLAVEQRIDSMLAEHEAEATRIVQEARTQAAEIARGWDASLQTAIEQLRQQIDRERAATVRDIEANAEAEAARYRKLGPPEICELARWLATHVAQDPDAP